MRNTPILAELRKEFPPIMILGATFLLNPANTLESWWRNCRALVANSRPRPRYSDNEEVHIARMGSVHAGCPPLPLHLYPSDTTRERPTRAGIERLRHNSRHNFSRCAAAIASGQAGSGVAQFRGETGVTTQTTTQHEIGLTSSPPEVLENMVELVGIESLGGVDTT